MKIGDIVVRKSYGKDITFKIIDINNDVYTIKGINLRIIADSPLEDLEELRISNLSKNEKNYEKQINKSIRRILVQRENTGGEFRSERLNTSKELTFGRPGKILHIDGDEDYLDTCLKVYSQLSLDAVGRTVPEMEQPLIVTDLVKEIKPDIVVLTGHDAISKNIKDYMDLANYKNSQYFVKAVSALRNYESSYDDLVIFAGACQSCYEAILDAGANFASSPNRVLIHCLDPVFICEKIAYTNIDTIVSIQQALGNTITGIGGIGGLQTRGKYREGFPKSNFL